MLRETIEKIKPIDTDLMEEAQRKLDNLTKPQGSLGRLEEWAKQVVGITGKIEPNLERKVIFTMAGDHGVVEERVSAYPKEVTPQMVYNFLSGGAGINVLAKHVGAEVVVVDMGVAEELKTQNSKLKTKKIGYGTKNMAKGPAMTRDEAIRAIEAGIEVFEEEGKIDIVGTGDMGIANTTPSSAIVAVFTGESPERVTGKGTGIDDASWRNKVEVIERALEVNKPDPSDPIDVLSKIGGFEIGGLVGVILAGAAHRIPVVIDGFISGAAALIAVGLEPKVKDYLFAAHCSVEIGHRIALEKMGLRPILDLNLRLGEGTGAALGINLIDAGCKILTQMATFGSAGVSEKVR
ncbi:MAG: nicotinate-nucleotide--dimethylbenzimidazole phosphoribosyltransferase [bacterium]